MSQGGLDLGPDLRPPDPWWRPKVQRAADAACGVCGEGQGYGWIGSTRIVGCYACCRDAEKSGEAVAT